MSPDPPHGSAPVWRNWAGNQTARPGRVVTVATEADVVAAVREATVRGQRLKPVGSGHSFTAIGVADGVQLRLDGLTGVVGFDSAAGTVTVRAGTSLADLNAALHALGYALPNLGDIDRQGVAGALSTGTHGTGARLPGLAAGVTGLRLVTADGQVLDLTTASGKVFEAARIGLGALGVVTQVTLEVVPAFLLHALETPEPLGRVLEDLDVLVRANDHFEFYWFPHTERTLTKRNNRVGPGTARRPVPAWRARLDDDLLSNRLFEVTNRLSAARPDWVPRISSVAARALGTREYVDHSHRVFVSDRAVRFVESEWAFEADAASAVLSELRAWIDSHDARIPFPVEVRFAAADDVWLSTAYGRASCYVAIHQYVGMDHRAYFAAFEAIAMAHGGRPHWGKLHTRGADYLSTAYPRFEDFRRVRDAVDPDRVFANDYLDHVLGP